MQVYKPALKCHCPVPPCLQAMFLMALRISRLSEEGRLSHEQASLVKAWNTLRGRECVALARELLGGNGVVTDYQVAKVFCDMEVRQCNGVL